MVEITKSVKTLKTYLHYFEIDDELIVEKFGSLDRFMTLLNKSDDPTDEEELALDELDSLVNDMLEPTETVEIEGEYDEQELHFGKASPEDRRFTHW